MVDLIGIQPDILLFYRTKIRINVPEDTGGLVDCVIEVRGGRQKGEVSD